MRRTWKDGHGTVGHGLLEVYNFPLWTFSLPDDTTAMASTAETQAL